MKNIEKLKGDRVQVLRLRGSGRFVRLWLTALVLPLIISACATGTEFLAQNSPAALKAALSRGRAELACPDATATVLSEKITHIQGLGIGLRGDGQEWSEHTIGVKGCGKHVIYEALCHDEDNCKIFAQNYRTRGVQQ